MMIRDGTPFRLVVGGHAVAVVPPAAHDTVWRLTEKLAAALDRPVQVM